MEVLGMELVRDRKVVITITYDLNSGQVTLNAPIQEKVLCLGLLELAKSVISNTQVSDITIPQFIPPKNISGS